MINLTWQELGIIFTLLLAIGGVLIKYVKSLFDAAKDETARVRVDVIEAHKRLDTHIHETALYREGVAQRYVTMDTIRAVESRFVDAINKLTDRIDKVLSGK